MKKDIQNKTNIETTNSPKSNLKLELIVWGIITIIGSVLGMISNEAQIIVYPLLIFVAYVIKRYLSVPLPLLCAFIPILFFYPILSVWVLGYCVIHYCLKSKIKWRIPTWIYMPVLYTFLIYLYFENYNKDYYCCPNCFCEPILYPSLNGMNLLVLYLSSSVFLIFLNIIHWSFRKIYHKFFKQFVDRHLFLSKIGCVISVILEPVFWVLLLALPLDVFDYLVKY